MTREFNKISFIFLIFFSFSLSLVYGEPQSKDFDPFPISKDFKIEKFVSGLNLPLTMEFLDDENLLVLEKNTGRVMHISNGVLQETPVLDLPVNSFGTKGLLGITSLNDDIYLFFTEAEEDHGKALGNRIYKYHWNGEHLVQPQLIKEIQLDGLDRPQHQGGPMVTSKEGKIFAVTGDNNQEDFNQNFFDQKRDDAGTIIILEEEEPFAIGIRNSFGIDIDPFSGNLWITENGPEIHDEINLVTQNSNNGWKKLMGPNSQNIDFSESEKFGFFYNEPKFSFESPIAITALSFVDSEIFPQYSDSILVGDFHTGNIYRFVLDSSRNNFIFDDTFLQDDVLNMGESPKNLIIATNFKGVGDIEVSPDGFIYIVSMGDGTIYRLIPSNEENELIQSNNCDELLQPKLDMSNCNLSNRIFQNIDINFSSFTNTSFTNSTFIDSSISNVDFINSDLRNVSFINSSMINSIISSSNHENSFFKDSFIRTSTYENSNLNSITVEDSQLRTALIINSNMNKANLEQVDLFGTQFVNSTLLSSSLENSDLSLNVFTNVDLTSTSIKNSDIYMAKFQNVDFTDSNLLGIYPYSTIFENNIFSESTKIDSCLSTDLTDRILNKILRELRAIEEINFDFIENIIINYCSVKNY